MNMDIRSPGRSAFAPATAPHKPNDPVTETVKLNRVTISCLRSVAKSMAKKTQLHFLLGVQYLRFGFSRMAQEHLKTALDDYNPAESCDEKWRRLMEVKMKLAYAQSLYDFASTSRSVAPGTGRAKRAGKNESASSSSSAQPSIVESAKHSRTLQESVVNKAIEEAKQLLTKLIKDESTRVDCWNNMGRLIYDDCKPAVARMVYDQIVNSFPDNFDLMNNLGFLRILGNEPEKAGTNFKDIISKCPTHVEALSNYGVHLIINKEDFKSAQKVLSQGLAVNQSEPHMWNALAISYLMEGNHDYARECFGQARKNEKYHTGAAWSIRFTIANYLRRQAAMKTSLDEKIKFFQGVKNLLDSVMSYEETSDVHLAIAKLHLSRSAALRAATPAEAKKYANPEDEDSEAQRHMISAIKIDRTNTRAWNELGLSVMRTGNSKKAIDFFKMAVQTDPRRPALWINLGLAYQLHGSHNDARRVLIKALELDKDSIEAMNNLANLHKAKGELDEAKKIYVRCINTLNASAHKTSPRSRKLLAQAYNNLALVSIKEGNYQKAMDNLQFAQERYPGMACVRQNIQRLALRLENRMNIEHS
ncbi:hypothetical protein AAMO2058_001533100 [Amorphochlora amoebiformis]